VARVLAVKALTCHIIGVIMRAYPTCEASSRPKAQGPAAPMKRTSAVERPLCVAVASGPSLRAHLANYERFVTQLFLMSNVTWWHYEHLACAVAQLKP
jgi:hypothetical protein